MALSLGMRGVVVLLDQSGAFDATSRKFTDQVLGKAGAGRPIRRLWRAAMSAVTGKVRMSKADGSYAVSPPFAMERGGVQGGMCTPWTYILGTTETTRGDESRGHDLDLAIRRACLRLEIQRRDGAALKPVEQAEGQLDEGLQRWNGAVTSGAWALLKARDEARRKLEEIEREVSGRSMRPARWDQAAMALWEDSGHAAAWVEE
eukprot:SAG11_NODE_10897_length_798_cov_1.207439_1_plen_203_part_10